MLAHRRPPARLPDRASWRPGGKPGGRQRGGVPTPRSPDADGLLAAAAAAPRRSSSLAGRCCDQEVIDAARRRDWPTGCAPGCGTSGAESGPAMARKRADRWRRPDARRRPPIRGRARRFSVTGSPTSTFASSAAGDGRLTVVVLATRVGDARSGAITADESQRPLGDPRWATGDPSIAAARSRERRCRPVIGVTIQQSPRRTCLAPTARKPRRARARWIGSYATQHVGRAPCRDGGDGRRSARASRLTGRLVPEIQAPKPRRRPARRCKRRSVDLRRGQRLDARIAATTMVPRGQGSSGL